MQKKVDKTLQNKVFLATEKNLLQRPAYKWVQNSDTDNCWYKEPMISICFASAGR